MKWNLWLQRMARTWENQWNSKSNDCFHQIFILLTTSIAQPFRSLIFHFRVKRVGFPLFGFYTNCEGLYADFCLKSLKRFDAIFYTNFASSFFSSFSSLRNLFLSLPRPLPICWDLSTRSQNSKERQKRKSNSGLIWREDERRKCPR